MARQLIIWFLIGQSVLTTFMSPLLILDYEIRKDYIAEYLCVNREKTDTVTVCAGKCYVTRNLLLLEEESQETETNFPPAYSFNLYQSGFTEIDLDSKIILSPELSFKPYLASYVPCFQHSMLKPPARA